MAKEKMNMLNKQDRKILIQLISDMQIKMIVKDHTLYESEDYLHLEQLKIKIKDMCEA